MEVYHNSVVATMSPSIEWDTCINVNVLGLVYDVSDVLGFRKWGGMTHIPISHICTCAYRY